MALKSSREGLRRELVDYLGNIIIDENLKQNIINSIDDIFVNNEELSTFVNSFDEKIRNETSSRENADNLLQNNINAETTSRQEAITNIENLINDGVLKADLLWTNASPKSAFAAQSINIDLNMYKLLLIYFNRSVDSDDNERYCFIGKVNEKFMCAIPRADTYYVNRRLVFFDDNRFLIGNSLIGFSLDIDNTMVIPYKIYGIK